MGRTTLFRDLRRLGAIAMECERLGIPTDEGIERFAQRQDPATDRGMTRRRFLQVGGATVLAGTATAVLPRPRAAWAAPPRRDVNVAIVGAGLAGLSCAYELRRRGITATIYDANDRVGGRCFSLPGLFPGQVSERGGEYIDTAHKTMLAYAREFGLAVEDVNKPKGDTLYHFGGSLHSEDQIVDEFRALFPAMNDDLRRSSGAPTADAHTDFDVTLDNTTLPDWLESRGAGDLIAQVIEAAYVGEFGRELEEQGAFNLLLYMHADRRSKFTPFGVFSDERYHVVDGNDRIPAALGDRLASQIELGHSLVAARRDSSGRVVLTLDDGPHTVTTTADAVVFAMPFSVLRLVDLDGLQLPSWKRFAIDNVVYGTNAKILVGFDGRPWADAGSDGNIYADLPRVQCTWESNPSRATDRHAVMVDFTGGRVGENLDPNDPQTEAQRFLSDLDVVIPGASSAATRDAGGSLRVDLWHWPSHPLWRGSYICNHPGYFTTIAGNESKPIGNAYFAGDHTSSFYDFQGFMEGAASSGVAAATRLLDDLKRARAG